MICSRHAWLLLVLLAAGCSSGPAVRHGGPAGVPDDYGVLVMAHGGSAEWNAGVLDAVAPLEDQHALEVAFGMADAVTIQEAVSKLEARGVRRIGVVRLFISGESWYERTEQILGLRPGAPPPPDPASAHDAHAAADPAHASHVDAAGHSAHAAHAAADSAHANQDEAAGDAAHAGHAHAAADSAHANHDEAAGDTAHAGGTHASHVEASGAASASHAGHSMELWRIRTESSFALSTQGLAEAEGMGQVLADRARALSRDPRREAVLVLAHGPGDDSENERWIAHIDARADAVRRALPFHRVQVMTLREDWPDKREEAERRIRAFVDEAASDGLTPVVIPFRVQGFGPYTKVLEGLDYAADERGLVPHAEVTRWIAEQIETLRDDFSISG